MPHSKRITLIRTNDLTLELEYNEEYAVLHLPYLRMTKTSYQEFLLTVEEVCQFLKDLGYEGVWTAIEPANRTIAKLLSRVDFAKIGEAEGLHVYSYKGTN